MALSTSCSGCHRPEKLPLWSLPALAASSLTDFALALEFGTMDFDSHASDNINLNARTNLTAAFRLGPSRVGAVQLLVRPKFAVYRLTGERQAAVES
jgi:hypothetical protein